MKRSFLCLCTILATAFFVFVPGKSKATHAAGGEIIYEWISGSTYRVFFKFYRDCTGAGAPTSQPLCYKNTCSSTVYSTNMAIYPGLIPPNDSNGASVKLGCAAAAKTTCDSVGATIPGYREWWYYADVTLPSQCNYWTFYTYIGNRNSSGNLGSATLPSNGLIFYTEATFDNLNFQGNSSPYFSNKPIPYVCVNVPFTFNNGAVDPNGDSLYTEVINPIAYSNATDCNGTTSPAPLYPQSPYPNITIPAHPIQTGGTFLLNGFTGQMSFTAPLVSAQTLSLRTKEYRNGSLVGSIIRDVQIQIIGNCTQTQPTISPTSFSGAQLINGQINGCAGQQLSFGFDLKSTNPNAVLIGSDNHLNSIPAANIVYTNQKTDSVRGTFTWTPLLTQSGLFTLTVAIKDSTCDAPGIVYSNVFTIPIFIWPPLKASNDTSVCAGQPVQLTVTGGGNYTWNTISGPPNTLTCTNCQAPVANTSANTSYMVTSNLTSFCARNKDTVNVTILPAPDFTPIPDILSCPDASTQLDLKLIPASNTTYTINWSPGTYLNSNTITNPVVTPKGDIVYHITITPNNNTCKGYDTVSIDVLDGFRINNEDTAICLGQSVQPNVTGDFRYSYTWATNDPSGGASISDPQIINPVITPSSVGLFTYTLSALYPGCKDSAASFKIDVQPIPTVTLPEDASMCYGDTMQLSSVVTPLYNYSYNWSPGNTLNNPNIPNPIFKALSSAILTLTASTSAGCKDDDDIALTVFPAHFLTVSNDTVICPRDSAYLSMTGNGLKSFYWSPAENINDINSAFPYVWPSTNQAYAVYGRDTNGCYDTAKVRITVKPAAILDIPESVTIYPGESYHMQPRSNAINFKWYPETGLSDPDIANPVAKPTVNTRYVIKAYTEFNCAVTDSINVIVSPDSHIEIPNAFAPGINSKLKVIYLGVAKLKSFSVFNRWGVKVFETNNIDEGWDGTYNGEPQPVGVYVYKIDAESYTGRKVNKQGNVTLIR